VLAVEPDHAVRAFRFKDVSARPAVPQLLRKVEIPIGRDLSEIVAIPDEMIPQQMLVAETLPACERRGRAAEKARGEKGISNA
jgi:hypothetical protein